MASSSSSSNNGACSGIWVRFCFGFKCSTIIVLLGREVEAFDEGKPISKLSIFVFEAL
ncbi:hypothetical protein TorRG33x02_278970, partial [Trema orientale]